MANSQCLLWAFFGKKKSGKKIDTQLSKQLKFENVNKKSSKSSILLIRSFMLKI